MILRDLGPGVTRLHGVRGLSGLRAVQQLRQIPQVHHLFRGHVLLLDLHILRKFAGDGVLVRGAALELAQQLLQCALIGGRAHQLTVHIQTVRLGDQTDLLGQVLLQRRLVYHVLPQQQAGGILQQGVVDGVALPQRPGGDRLQVRRGLLRCGLGAHSGNHLAVVQNRRCRRRRTTRWQQPRSRRTAASLDAGASGAPAWPAGQRPAHAAASGWRGSVRPAAPPEWAAFPRPAEATAQEAAQTPGTALPFSPVPDAASGGGYSWPFPPAPGSRSPQG